MRFLPRLRRFVRPRRLLAVVLGLSVLGYGGWLWLRDSSLVAVRDVSITGVSGSSASAVRSALRSAARGMTTVHLSEAQLLASVAAYPVVEDIEVKMDFPHRVSIRVLERLPVAVVAVAGGQRIPATADGFLLRSGASLDGLPEVRLKSAVGVRVTDARALHALALLGPAPRALRARVRSVYASRRGLAAGLESGPTLVFGTAERAAAKWAAAARVLADPAAAGGTYVDVRVPERPAVGGLPASPTGAATA
jgi:cell division protein FtsQ